MEIVGIVTAVLICACYIVTTLLKVFGWLKLEPSDVKRFIAIRGRPLAWSAYVIVATILTAYIFLVLSLVASFSTPSITLLTFIVLMAWGVIGIWSPAILKTFESKEVNVALQITFYLFVTLTVVLFWFVPNVEFQSKLFVTLLIVGVFVILIVDSVYKRRKAHKLR